MKRQELTPEIRALWEDPLSEEEFDRRLATYLADTDSIRDNIELIEWFLRRYPKAEQRLAYVRRKYMEWTRRPTRIAG